MRRKFWWFVFNTLAGWMNWVHDHHVLPYEDIPTIEENYDNSRRPEHFSRGFIEARKDEARYELW